MRSFYDVIKNKVLAGQYKMEEILAELSLAYEKNYIDLGQLEELKVLAETHIDMNYNGNKYATAYDLDQDLVVSVHDVSILELYELMMHTVEAQAYKQRGVADVFSVMTRSGIGDVYLRTVLNGTRLFSQVHFTKQQEVAEKLLSMGREDLIDVPEFLPEDVIDPEPGVEPSIEEVPEV